MDKTEFAELLKAAGLSKKEFAEIIDITPGSLNNWGSTQNIPYWVKSWLGNYIKAKSYNEMKEKVFEIEKIELV